MRRGQFPAQLVGWEQIFPESLLPIRDHAHTTSRGFELGSNSVLEGKRKSTSVKHRVMNWGDSSALKLPSNSRMWRLVAAVVIIALVLAGFFAYTDYQNSQCIGSLVGCPPYPSL